MPLPPAWPPAWPWGASQAICFGKDPSGHLEKTSRGFSLPLAGPKAVVHQAVGAHICTYRATPPVVTDVPKTCDPPQHLVPGTHSLAVGFAPGWGAGVSPVPGSQMCNAACWRT